LKNREGEADRAAPFFIVQVVRAIELLTDVFRHVLVECGFFWRQVVRHGVCEPVGKQRLALHRDELLLYHAPHDVARVNSVGGISRLALKPVAIN